MSPPPFSPVVQINRLRSSKGVHRWHSGRSFSTSFHLSSPLTSKHLPRTALVRSTPISGRFHGNRLGFKSALIRNDSTRSMSGFISYTLTESGVVHDLKLQTPSGRVGSCARDAFRPTVFVIDCRRTDRPVADLSVDAASASVSVSGPIISRCRTCPMYLRRAERQAVPPAPLLQYRLLQATMNDF